MWTLPFPPPDHPATARHLPEAGLAGAAVHELRAPAGTATHIALAAWLLGRLAGAAPIFWVSALTAAYPPGLAWLGLDPARVIFAAAKDDAESLGTLEVALRGGMAGVAEAGEVTRLAARRLGLAARKGGGIGLLLRHAARQTPADSTAFATRWMITPVPGQAGAMRFKAELLYAKGGRPNMFFYEITEGRDDTAPPALTLVAGMAEAAGQRKAG
jgi:protein ImuA